MSYQYRIGADENGLGAQLGPMIVTGVLARVSERGARALGRRLPKSIAAVLGDSKQLVSHGNVGLGEAWARSVAGGAASTPPELFETLGLEPTQTLKRACPERAMAQCWTTRQECFEADAITLAEVEKQRSALATRGIEIIGARVATLCTGYLNEQRARGRNRFVADLHAMERIVLSLRDRAGADVQAVCGKVGGMKDYSRFFGPLSHRLHSVLETSQARSAYHFPGLGELSFERDADARNPLVMLASLIGKYVRELTMARVGTYYQRLDPALPLASGYNDPVSGRLIAGSAPLRRKLRIVDTCFLRTRDAPGSG